MWRSAKRTQLFYRPSKNQLIPYVEQPAYAAALTAIMWGLSLDLLNQPRLIYVKREWRDLSAYRFVADAIHPLNGHEDTGIGL
jgi:hypothetical protein